MKKRYLIVMIAGVVAALMIAIPALASSRDGNGDGLPDRWEKSNQLSVNVNQAKRDQDRDGLRNMGEFRHGTDPRNDDSDNDGVEDGEDCASEVEGPDDSGDNDADEQGEHEGEHASGNQDDGDQEDCAAGGENEGSDD